MKAVKAKGRRRVLIGVVKRRLEELEMTHKWAAVSPELLMDLVIEARDRGSIVHMVPDKGWFRITDRKYGAVVLRADGKLEGQSFVIGKAT